MTMKRALRSGLKESAPGVPAKELKARELDVLIGRTATISHMSGAPIRSALVTSGAMIAVTDPTPPVKGRMDTHKLYMIR